MSHHALHFDITPYVTAVLRVMTEPYDLLIEHLYRDGRVTDAEVAALRQAILDRGERLAHLVQAELQASQPSRPATDPYQT